MLKNVDMGKYNVTRSIVGLWILRFATIVLQTTFFAPVTRPSSEFSNDGLSASAENLI